MGYVQLTLLKPDSWTPLDMHYQSFLLDKEAARLSRKTLEHYRYTTGGFVAWLESRGVKTAEGITPNHIRQYLVGIQRRGLKDTTQHAIARGIKTWLKWLVREGILDSSPMNKVTMPKLEDRIPPPFSPENVKELLRACDGKSHRDLRDRAILLVLLDTGIRAAEIIGLKVGSIDIRSGMVTVMGKGRKQRQVHLGTKARQAILRYLATRDNPTPDSPLWVGYYRDGSERGALTYRGLGIVCKYLGQRAGVSPSNPHRFRRTFALWCLRDGMDLHSLKLLMGHKTLDVLQRYLALAGEDIERAHSQHSPVDRLL